MGAVESDRPRTGSACGIQLASPILPSPVGHRDPRSVGVCSASQLLGVDIHRENAYDESCNHRKLAA